MSDEAQDRDGPGDDETRPLHFEPPPLLTDPEPAVAAALAVIERSLTEMGSYPTRPLLDPPPRPYRLRPIGATGLAVFPVMLDVSPLGRADDRASAHRVLDAYAGLGGNALVVTDAPDARAAETVGGWLAERRSQEATVLVGRVGASGLSAAQLTAAVDRLLARLDVPRLDLLVLTGADRAVPFEETLTALAGLAEQERVGHLAAGDHSASRLIQARVMAGQRGLPRFEAVAPVLNLLQRETYERDVSGVAHAQSLACLPVSPLAGGFLAGAVASRSAFRRMRELDPQKAERMQPWLSRRGLRVLETLVRIGDQREVPPAAVALAWLLTRPHVAAPIVAAGTVEQVRAAGAAAGVHLSRAEVTALERAGE